MHAFVSLNISRRVGLKHCELFVSGFSMHFCFPTTGDKIFVTLSRSSNELASYKRTQHYLANNSQHWMLYVTSVCTPCCMLLHVVGSCCAKFETGQATCKRTQQLSTPTTSNISFIPWSTKRSATMLDPFAQLFQHCLGPRTRITHNLLGVYKVLWVVSSRCTAGPNIVVSCCIHLHTTANTDGTTLNTVGSCYT